MKKIAQAGLLLYLAVCYLQIANTTASAEGFVLGGFFVHRTRSGEDTNRFRIEVKDGQYNLRVGSLTGTNLEDVEIGSDGVDTYQVRGIDNHYPPSVRTIRGEVGPGTMPCADIFGNQAINQILWLAFASAKETSKNDHNHTNLVPNLIFLSEDWLPLWDMRVDLKMDLRLDGLPTDVKYFCPNYVLVDKSELPADTTAKPSLIPGKYEVNYAAPLTNGYLIAAYTVTTTTNFNGNLIPSGFLFVRFSPIPKAQTDDSLIAVNTYEGFVQTVAYLDGRTSFLPKHKPGLIQDYRLGSANGGGVIYTKEDGQWINRQDNMFRSVSSAYLNHGNNNEHGKAIKRIVIIIILSMLSVLPPMLFMGRRWLSKKTN